MNIDNEFDLIVAVAFSTSPQLGGIGFRSQEILISFFLGERDTLPQLKFRDIQSRSGNFLMNYKTRQINTLTGKYIIELSKLKHIKMLHDYL